MQFSHKNSYSRKDIFLNLTKSTEKKILYTLGQVKPNNKKFIKSHACMHIIVRSEIPAENSDNILTRELSDW